MKTPPPTLPGMPWANSSPASCARCAAAAARAIGQPAPARSSSPAADTPSMAAVQSTTASSPPSGTSRLVPLPMTTGRTPSPYMSFSSFAASSSSAGRQNSRAGPPMRKEQCALMGSYSRARSALSTARSARTRLSLKGML